MLDHDRFSRAALRGVLAELDANPEGAGHLLARLFASPTATSPVVAPADDDRRDDGEDADRNAFDADDPGLGLALMRQAQNRLAAGLDDEDLEDHVVDDRPATRAAAKATPSRKPTRKPKGKAKSEGAALVEQLVTRHGSVRVAAKVAGISEPQLRRWRNGQALTPASLARLRAALEGKPAETLPPRATKGHREPAPHLPALAEATQELVDVHEGIRATARALRTGKNNVAAWLRGEGTPATLERVRAALAERRDDAEPDDQGAMDAASAPDEPDAPDEPEQARLARELEERHGRDAISDRWGWSADALERWKAGKPCTARVLSDLRAAVAADPLAPGVLEQTRERAQALQEANRAPEEGAHQREPEAPDPA